MAGKRPVPDLRASFLHVGVLLLLRACTPPAGAAQDISTFLPLFFEQEPEDVSRLEGSSALFNCTVAPHAEVEIRWRQNGSILKMDEDSRSSLLANGSLHLTDLQEADQGTYECIAELAGMGRIVSRGARLSLIASPVFAEEPRNLSVLIGDTAYLPCFSGNAEKPPLWYKDEQLLSESAHAIFLPSGALEITSARLLDRGLYYCEVENQVERRFSRSAWLDVLIDPVRVSRHKPPAFVVVPRDVVLQEGATANLDCAANGIPKPRISWLRDGGATLDFSHLDSRIRAVGSSSISIVGAREEDSGTYVCRAVSREGTANASARVVVHVPPRVAPGPPRRIVAREREDVRLECRVSGTPPPDVLWLRNGELLEEASFLTLAPDGSLSVQGLTPEDSGAYQCLASNPAGSVRSTVYLHVQSVRSMRGEGGTEDLPSEPRNLRATFISTRSVELNWSLPERGPVDAYALTYWQDGSSRERAVNITTEGTDVGNLQPSSKYNFQVAAWNFAGLGPSSPVLTILTQEEDRVPSPPSNFRVLPVSPRALLASWEPPADAGQQCLKTCNYTVYYIAEDDSSERSVVTSERELLLSGLGKNTLYLVWATANAEGASGRSTEEVAVRTLGDRPDAPPQNVSAEPASATSVVVNWEPLPEKDRNGAITGYRVRYRPRHHGGGAGASRKEAGETLDASGGGRRSILISGLQRGAAYSVRVAAQNINGTGPASDWVEVRTLDNDLDESRVPDPPESIRARPSATSIQVSWTPPSDATTMVRGYTIGYGVGIPDVYRQVLSSGHRRQYEIRDLRPNAEYVLSLRAYNLVGDGPPIYETVRTHPESPSSTADEDPIVPPVGLTSLADSPTSIVLSWSDSDAGSSPHSPGAAAEATEGRVYTVRYRTRLHARFRYRNTTRRTLRVEGLRPDTLYEFSVRAVQGRKHSDWSLVLANSTQEASPDSPPRDLTIVPHATLRGVVSLHWQPPRLSNGRITGYVISYTSNRTQGEREWIVGGIVGDRMTTSIHSLIPDTTYYFKIQARNRKGYGPFSQVISYHTQPASPGTLSGDAKWYALYASVALVMSMLLAGSVFFCMRKHLMENAKRNRKGYIKGEKRLETTVPPDLWCEHQDHILEMRARSADWTEELSSEKGGEEATAGDDHHLHTNHRHHDDGANSFRRPAKPRPIMIPIDAQPPKEPVALATSLGNGGAIIYSRSGGRKKLIPARLPNGMIQSDSPCDSPGSEQNPNDTSSSSKSSLGCPLRSFGAFPSSPTSSSEFNLSSPFQVRKLKRPPSSPGRGPCLQTGGGVDAEREEEQQQQIAVLEHIIKDLSEIRITE